MKIRAKLIKILLMGLLFLSLPAAAMSLDEAVSRVRAEHGGRVLSAQTVMADGRSVHVVRILTGDGRVRQVRMPAGPNGRPGPGPNGRPGPGPRHHRRPMR